MGAVKAQLKNGKVVSGGDRRAFFLLYSLCFIVLAAIIYSPHYLNGKGLIWEDDGFEQHYTALVWYSHYLRDIIGNLFTQGRLIVPQWEFYVTEGSDIMSAFHYYIIGDPISSLCVFVPTAFMHIFFDFEMLLRVYLSGFFFSCFCFELDRRDKYAVLTGSLIYAFSEWLTGYAALHPYFVNPGLYFPLLLWGLEKLLKGGKPWLFTAAVALSCMCNLTFFYVLVIMTVIYALGRLLVSYRSRFREGLMLMLKAGLFSVLGVLLAAAVLFPAAWNYLNDPRMLVETTHTLLYPFVYYSTLPGMFIGEGLNTYTSMGFSAPVLPALLMMLTKKGKHTLLKVYTAAGLVILLLPFLGRFLNCMAYTSNRWIWAYAMLMSFIFVEMWPELKDITPAAAAKVTGGMAVYALICFGFKYSRIPSVFTAIAIAFIFLMLMLCVKDMDPFRGLYGKKHLLALALAVLGILNTGWYMSHEGSNFYRTDFVPYEDFPERLGWNEARHIKDIYAAEAAEGSISTRAFPDTDSIRYSGRGLTKNSGLVEKLSATQYDWSLSSPYISDYRFGFGLPEMRSWLYRGYDDRTFLNTLSSVRYFAVNGGEEEPVPYGFEFVGTYNVRQELTDRHVRALEEELGTQEPAERQLSRINKNTSVPFSIFKNTHALPMSYFYKDIYSQEAWEGLSFPEKQEVMLKYAVVDDYDGALPLSGQCSLNTVEIPYELEINSDEVSLNNGSFVVTSPNSEVNLSFSGLPDSETYVVIEGLEYDWVKEYDLYFGQASLDPYDLYTVEDWNTMSDRDRRRIKEDSLYSTYPIEAPVFIKGSNDIEKELGYYTDRNVYYEGRHDFSVNLDYSREALNSATIEFDRRGVYHFDSIKVYCQPMTDYVSSVEKLGEHYLQELKFDTNTITGNIDVEEAGLLCISQCYSKGWRAFVDGREAKLWQVNVKNMGLELSPGHHDIELVYREPLMAEGRLVSLVTLAAIFVWIFVFEKRMEVRYAL